MNLFSAKALLKLAADLFLKPGRDGHFRLRDVQAERRFFCVLTFGLRDELVVLHLSKDQVAAADGLLRVKQRRESYRTFRQAGKQSGFGESEIPGMLAEVKLGSSFKAVHAVAQVDLVSVEGEDLLLCKVAFNLDGEIGFLNFARGCSLGGEK